MNVNRLASAAGLFSLAASLSLASPVFGQTGAAPRLGVPQGSIKATDRQQKASGVIVKVERIEKGATKGATIRKETEAGRAAPVSYRLTINTAAVWRDWSRDQARVKDSGSPAKDARRGNESVATRGEPAEPNSLVVVDLGPETRVDTRFRAPDDETSKGARAGEASRSAAKPLQFTASELKPGLFVDVDYTHQAAQNPASAVSVIRPILETNRTDAGHSK